MNLLSPALILCSFEQVLITWKGMDVVGVQGMAKCVHVES